MYMWHHLIGGVYLMDIEKIHFYIGTKPWFLKCSDDVKPYFKNMV